MSACTTPRSVRLKYAAEDALRLADDLASAQLFTVAEHARAIGLACMAARDEEEQNAETEAALFSVRV